MVRRFKSEEIVFWRLTEKLFGMNVGAGILYKANPDDQIKHYYPSALSASLARYNEKPFLQENWFAYVPLFILME